MSGFVTFSITCFLGLAVPLSAVSGLVLLRHKTLLDAMISWCFFALLVAISAMLTPWEVLTIWLMPLLWIAFAGGSCVLLWRHRRCQFYRGGGWKRWLMRASYGMGAILLGVTWLPAVLADFPEAPVLIIRDPLPDVDAYVRAAGPHILINHHVAVQAQRYGVDVVALNGWGTRSNTFLPPQQVTDMVIYDARIVAPCSGLVLATETERPEGEMEPATPDVVHPAGNYVALYCDDQDRTLLLAHMRPRTVAVQGGDKVAAGEFIGRVGSSGNSTEPHLHLHAVDGKVNRMRDLLYDGQPVVLKMGGRPLVRGDRVSKSP